MEGADRNYKIEVHYSFAETRDKQDSEAILGFLGKRGLRFTLREKVAGQPVLLQTGYYAYSANDIKKDPERIAGDLKRVQEFVDWR